MDWYIKYALIKIANKFIPWRTFRCGHCDSRLMVRSVVNNPNHHFNPGQLYTCSCGKSAVWCNSVRKPKQLIEYCDGSQDSWVVRDTEQFGFCNDAYCPFCWHYIQMLDMGGFISKGRDGREQHHDVYGCEQSCCPDNKNLIELPNGKDGEHDGQMNLAHWYRDHQGLWRPLVEK